MNRSDSPSPPSPVDRAVEATVHAIDAPDRYPSGASFIAADLPSFDAHFRRATGEGRPVVVVLPDGDELLLQPRQGSLSHVLRRTLRVLARLFPSTDAGPLIRNGAPGEPFDVPLVRLSVTGYETHLHGLRR